jgi:hypothetical protein
MLIVFFMFVTVPCLVEASIEFCRMKAIVSGREQGFTCIFFLKGEVLAFYFLSRL